MRCHVCASTGRCRRVGDLDRALHPPAVARHPPRFAGRHHDGRALSLTHTGTEGACALRGGARRPSETNPRSAQRRQRACRLYRLVSFPSALAAAARTRAFPPRKYLFLMQHARAGCVRGTAENRQRKGGGMGRRAPWCSFAGSAARPSFIFAIRSARGGDDWTNTGASGGRKRSVCALTDLPKFAPFIIALRSLWPGWRNAAVLTRAVARNPAACHTDPDGPCAYVVFGGPRDGVDWPSCGGWRRRGAI